jgi:deaminated glutathione amidase
MPKIGLVQLTSGIDPAANAALTADALREAAGDGADLIVTPEMTGLLDNNRARLAANAQPIDSDLTILAAQTVARETGVTILIGSVPVPLDTAHNGQERYANRSVLISKVGTVIATYDKMHLFDVDLPTGERYRESATYTAGSTVPVVATPAGQLGLTICYDLRFPHLYRALAQAGAEMIVVPAAFTRPTGEAHWHTLLKARAIETGCFILAPAQTGSHADGRTTYGHSLVVNPWGDIVCDMGTLPGVAVVDIDLAEVSQARARIPAWTTNQTFEVHNVQ